ncbi:MAG TPA: hypothetical protein VJ892_00040 [Candidatus Absconditabacterales bacterium]|nr:hypothetical protein [Candidatus Absconditabacterales bacterium]
MKIGIVTSGNEVLTLFKFLNKFEHEYFVYYDQNNWPYGDKNFDVSLNYVEKGIKYLKDKGVDKVVISPVYELYFLNNKKYSDLILPLFSEYLHKFCFGQSLVGKIGLIGDFADIQVAQDLVSDLSKQYKLSENQSKIRKFNFPFKFWCKEVPMWKYFATKLSFSNLMVNRVIKFDLRYFKDANVDTIVPLNYEYFNYQNTIFKFFNFKKQRFHKFDKLEKIFREINLKESKYGVNFYVNGHVEFLKREKKTLWNIQRGKSIELKIVNC